MVAGLGSSGVKLHEYWAEDSLQIDPHTPATRSASDSRAEDPSASRRPSGGPAPPPSVRRPLSVREFDRRHRLL